MNENSVSIIIPVYNAGKYLKRCLESLIERTDDDEVILVNDGSSDNSQSICEQFQKNEKNIKLINQINAGVSVARNTGIDAATRNWIMFVDADDYLISGWRMVVQKALESSNEINIIVFEQNIKSGLIEMQEGVSAAVGYNRSLGSSLGFPFSKLYRTEMLQKENIRFSTKLINGEDMIFNAKAFAVCGGGMAVSQSVYAYYKNMSSATNRFDPDIIETEHEFHRELQELFCEYNLNDKKWEDISKLSLLNGLYAVAYRIALGAEKENFKLLEKLICENEYNSVLLSLSYYKKNISRKKYPALAMLARSNTRLAIKYIQVICLLKRMYYKKKKNGVVSII